MFAMEGVHSFEHFFNDVLDLYTVELDLLVYDSEQIVLNIVEDHHAR